MEQLQDRLDLDSRLTELSRVQPWVEQIADRCGLGQDARFAIHLCMEEALANVILHGYGGEPGHPVVIRSWATDAALFFAIEDKATPFAPDEPAGTTGSGNPVPLEELKPGGNGIPLMRHFAGSLVYERLPDGNRLTLGFPLPGTRPLG